MSASGTIYIPKTQNILKILLILGFSCSILSVLVCKDLTPYLIMFLLLSSFICLLQSKQKFIVPIALFWVIAAWKT